MTSTRLDSAVATPPGWTWHHAVTGAPEPTTVPADADAVAAELGL